MGCKGNVAYLEELHKVEENVHTVHAEYLWLVEADGMNLRI